MKKEPYIGSVLFFKHLILLTLILLITVPTITSGILAYNLFRAKDAVGDLHAQVEAVQSELAALQMNVIQMVEVEETAPVPNAEVPDYALLYPDFYAPEVDYASVVKDKVCYLTFDDGPSVRTDEVLDILQKEEAKATFFVTYQPGEANEARLKRAVEEGHTVGLHSASHKYSTIYASVEGFLEDYYQLFTWVTEVTGQPPTVFRFPGGSINGHNRHIYQEIIAEMTRRGFVYFDWNVSSGDAAAATPTPTAQVRDNCLKDIVRRNRAIVLMHDSASKTTTVEALPAIIGGAKENAFTLEALTSEVKPVVFAYRD